MKKIAAIDIGTNSVLYSLFEFKGRRISSELYFERHSPRIGSKLAGQRRPRISEDSYLALNKILARNVRHATRNGADEILIAATNPLRKAANGPAIKKRLESDLKCEVIILTPEQEAYLSFLGAVGYLRKDRAAMVIDMGGGSTEFVVYRGDHRKVFHSVPEGAVSLTERFDSTGPVDPSRFERFEKYLSRYINRLDDIRRYLHLPIKLVGGTSTALAYLKDEHVLQRPRGVSLTGAEIDRFVGLLAPLNIGRRRQLLGIDKNRATIIFAGAFWYKYLFKILSVNKAVATPRGLRHGLATDFVSKGIITA